LASPGKKTFDLNSSLRAVHANAVLLRLADPSTSADGSADATAAGKRQARRKLFMAQHFTIARTLSELRNYDERRRRWKTSVPEPHPRPRALRSSSHMGSPSVTNDATAADKDSVEVEARDRSYQVYMHETHSSHCCWLANKMNPSEFVFPIRTPGVQAARDFRPY
jgi:hypothetical protein